MQIEDYLYGRKLHLPLLGTKLESMKAEEWALLDRQVLGVIRLTLSRSVAHNVVKEKTTTDLMKALSGMYEKLSANNKVHLMKKLFNLKMAENASVTQHLNEFNTITNQLSSVEIDFDDEIRALIVLASLPNSWEAMRMAISNSTGKEKLKYNDIRDLILAEEIRRRDAGETSGSGSALNLETRGKGNDRNSNRGRSNSRNSNRNRSKSRSGQQVQCWNYSPLDDWVLDSGASFHTTPHREIIQNYVASDFGKVYLADGSTLDVVGLGDVQISLPNGSVWLLEKVRHIPDLRRNLIFVGQLDDEGHAILFVCGTWKVTKGARVLARGKKTGTLLGHMSEKGMKMLLSKGKLPELKSIDFDMCESCILGKQKKVSFLKTGKTPKAEKLELVHTDLWGDYYSKIASLGGSRYYITFIDDSSRKVWVYFLKNKYDVFETFKKWKAMVETETSLKVKCLRSDNGGEYIDGGFSEYCAAQGIGMEKTIPRTPQQNGVAERMNRTLNERARSMSCTYTINRGPSVPMEFKLPEEVMYKDRSTVVSDVTEIDKKKSKFVNLDELTEKLAMKDEMDSLLGNQTWELIELPVRKKALHNKWVYKIKNEHDGSKRYKARLVIFSPIVKMSTIRLVLGMVAAENLHIEQLDVKTSFLYGDLEEDLYMIQPEGFIVQGQENLVCKLRKSLYGLKQAPRQWYKNFDNFMHRIGFKRCEADHCCYVKSFDNSYIILLLYVDDMLIIGFDIEKINNLKKQLSKQFAMKDLGAAKQILGMRIIRDKANGTLKLSRVCEESSQKKNNPKRRRKGPYEQGALCLTIGDLMYAMVCTRPNIAHAGVAIKWILRYLKGSLDTCLCFTCASLKLQCYVNADFVGDIDSRKSTTGFVFTLGGTAISWTSNLQKNVTLSTKEAKYVEATEAGKDMIWLHGFLDELGKNQSAIFLAKNSVFHSKSKHIQTKYHFIHYLVEDKLVILEKICGSKNPADMLTKGVTIEKLKLCVASIGLLA
ncbi:hypothetical protein AAG906_039119 [Vitis piasezkii]